jgi:WD40 repeat protein
MRPRTGWAILFVLLAPGDQGLQFPPPRQLLPDGMADVAPRGGHIPEPKFRWALKGRGGEVEALAFSPDGKTLACTSHGQDPRQVPDARRGPQVWGEIKLWDVSTGRELSSFRAHDQEVTSLAFSPDSRTLATSGRDRYVRLWDVATEKEVASLGPVGESACCLAFNPDGKRLAASGSFRAWLWDVESRAELHSLAWSRGIRAPALSPDLQTLALDFHQDMDLWDMGTGAVRLTLPDHRGSANCAAFSPDGKTVAVGSSREAGHTRYMTEVKLWNPATGEERASLKAAPGYVDRVLFNSDGKTLAVLGGRDFRTTNEVKLLDAATGETIATLPFKNYYESPKSLAFSADAKVLAVGCGDGTVRLWDLIPRAK